MKYLTQNFNCGCDSIAHGKKIGIQCRINRHVLGDICLLNWVHILTSSLTDVDVSHNVNSYPKLTYEKT